MLEDRDIRSRQQRQQPSEHFPLQSRLPRFAERKSERPRHGERARRADFSGDLRKHGQGCGDDPSPLDLRLNQADRLVAERSNRHEERHIDRILLQQRCSSRRGVADETAGRRDRAHEGEVSWRHLADDARFGELVQPVERQR